MTDGWNWSRPPTSPSSGDPRQQPYGPPPGSPASPWWSDALTDPWRDPYAPSAVVLPAPPPTGGPQLDTPPNPDAPRRPLASIMVICLVTALLAGGVGGTLGFLFAVKGGYVDAGRTALGAPGQNTPESAQRAEESFGGVVQRVQPSVVTVRVSGAIGSGFVVSADGYVITNDHVVEGGDSSLSVSFHDGSTAAAKLIGRDPESDLAVIKVAKDGLTPVALGNSDQIAVGDHVLAFGSPLALVNTVTAGIVSALDRTIQAGEESGTTRYYAAIQTDAAVNQGNSGGPLVDAAGEVVGVNSVIRSVGGSTTEAGNIGLAFAIPINQAKRIAEDIIDTGKARRTVIGAEVITGEAASGARLRAVESGGPAAAAGLRAGDVVTKLDGRPLDDGTGLIAMVRKYAPGSVVAVEYRRGSKPSSASVTLAADTN
ncbi:trypsin-like peptidase domain-containing protein [Actinoplanes sp. NEAU-A12]|uniref:Trypsin-like peptidase domain-containing protein n=1 Tax=Actinoplanes sandaracinus TaxID=3045177 RepID=A0ABT6WJM9_9ACTN|nr:trypsin-like peptidase domain-containing protein [Actinoplanes sandaracinus]MDI6099860.1 trypsin-like peptidase domain-containing protein [Actinoplanes sandaracinus]